MDANRFEEIKERHAAATPGPWRWWGSTDMHSLELVAPRLMHRAVMAVRRWGMRSAQPMFRDSETGILVPVAQIARFQVHYRNDFNGIENPDAEFIEHSWQDVADLVAEVERLRAGEERSVA